MFVHYTPSATFAAVGWGWFTFPFLFQKEGAPLGVWQRGGDQKTRLMPRKGNSAAIPWKILLPTSTYSVSFITSPALPMHCGTHCNMYVDAYVFHLILVLFKITSIYKWKLYIAPNYDGAGVNGRKDFFLILSFSRKTADSFLIPAIPTCSIVSRYNKSSNDNGQIKNNQTMH